MFKHKVIANITKPTHIVIGKEEGNFIKEKDYRQLLSDAPHILVAGHTGTGKSVLLKSMILSLMKYNTPCFG